MAGNNTIELLIRLIGQDADLTASLNRAQKGLKSVGAEGAAAGKVGAAGLDGISSSALRMISALGGAYVGFQGIRSLLSDFLRTASQFETARIQLNSLFGDADKGAAAFAWVKDFARDTPYELDGVLKAFQTLKNFGLDPMDGTLQAVADQSAKFGARQEDLEGISLALGQAWAAQRLQGQDILQLITRGVPVWQLLQDVTGKNTAELRKMSEAGELGRDVISALIQRMGEASTGAAAAQMQAFGGIVSNVKDTWAQFLDGVGQAGALDALKTELSGVLDKVTELNDSGALSSFATSISGGITTAVRLVGDLAAALGGLAAVLRPLAELWVANKVFAYAKGLQAVSIAAPLTETAIIGVNGALVALGRSMAALPFVFMVDRLLALTQVALEHYNTVKDINQAYDEFRRKQEQIKASSSGDAFATIVPPEEFSRMTKVEQDAYAQRLRNAEAFWKADFNLRTRSGDTGEGARRANQYTREYTKSLQDIKSVLDKRAAAEAAAADRISAIKKEETDRLVQELGRQKQAYDKAQSDLKQILSERESLLKEAAKNQEDIKKEFADLTENVRTPTQSSVTLQSFAAQRALTAGDPKEALRQAREAADELRKLQQESGPTASGKLTGQRLQKVAADAQLELDKRKLEENSAAAEAIKANIANIDQAITDLVTRLKELEAIKIGFDRAKAITDAQTLWQAINAEFASKPIIVKVQLDRTDLTSAGEQVVKNAEVVPGQNRAFGGPITGYSPTPTADNIPVNATAGEYMQSVAAVRHAGMPFMHALNARLIPRGAIDELMRRMNGQRLAMGGPVLPAIPSLPSLPSSPTPSADTVMLLDLNGRRYRARADAGTAHELDRALRLERLKS